MSRLPLQQPPGWASPQSGPVYFPHHRKGQQPAYASQGRALCLSWPQGHLGQELKAKTPEGARTGCGGLAFSVVCQAPWKEGHTGKYLLLGCTHWDSTPAKSSNGGLSLSLATTGHLCFLGNHISVLSQTLSRDFLSTQLLTPFSHQLALSSSPGQSREVAAQGGQDIPQS